MTFEQYLEAIIEATDFQARENLIQSAVFDLGEAEAERLRSQLIDQGIIRDDTLVGATDDPLEGQEAAEAAARPSMPRGRSSGSRSGPSVCTGVSSRPPRTSSRT
jgi:hypothetical protein